MDLELLRERAGIIRRIRRFFDSRHYLETDTPILSPDLIPESCLEVFETRNLPPKGSRSKEKPYWLVPSPEIWMKRLIARHGVNLYQICKCFRNGESLGPNHNPEFTMLEYYTLDAGYRDSLKLTEELFSYLLSDSGGKETERLSQRFIVMTVEEAFACWAGFDLYRAAAQEGAMEEEASRLGLYPQPGLTVHQLYDLIFINNIEGRLKMEKPVVLIDYPAFIPCLAKKNPNGKTVERWELYFRGIELANCYSEETDAEKVQEFFEREKAEKEKSAMVVHKVDDAYYKILTKTRALSGVAMGLDRLIMALCGKKTIDGILPFPMNWR